MAIDLPRSMGEILFYDSIYSGHAITRYVTYINLCDPV